MYKNFEDWFFELENYCLRCERFYDSVSGVVIDATRNKSIRTRSLEQWLRAAFEAGKESK